MITDLKQQVDVDADVAEYTKAASSEDGSEDAVMTEENPDGTDSGNDTEHSDSVEPEEQ